MSIRRETPCDFGECPYNAEYGSTCEYWCGEDEPEEDYDDCGFDAYMGEYTYDC